MPSSIDLHTHTTASDGSLTPSQLVRYAKEKGLTVIAVTDHDAIEGNAEAMAEGEREAVTVVPGVEISVDHSPGSMHMLGFFIDAQSTGLSEKLRLLQDSRADRNPRIIQKLNELGVRLNYQEVIVRNHPAGYAVGFLCKADGWENGIKAAFALAVTGKCQTMRIHGFGKANIGNRAVGQRTFERSVHERAEIEVGDADETVGDNVVFVIEHKGPGKGSHVAENHHQRRSGNDQKLTGGGIYLVIHGSSSGVAKTPISKSPEPPWSRGNKAGTYLCHLTVPKMPESLFFDFSRLEQ